jgi:hypothetical protein
MRVSGQRHAPATLYLPVPIVQEAGWAPEPVWTQRPLPGIEPRSSGRPYPDIILTELPGSHLKYYLDEIRS